MNKPSIGSACNITTGKLDSNHAVEGGQYPFYTCAPTPGTIDSFAFNDNVVLVAGNNAQGNFHVNRYKGKFNAYQRTYVLTAKSGYDIDFIYYSLKLELKRLKERSQGSQTKFLTMPILTNIHLRNLDKTEQQKISTVLSTLDAKIGLNNLINAELGAMAKTLYNYWFVQFDFPNADGKPYKSSGSKMVWNEELKREIPEGWQGKKLGTFGDFKNGINYDPSIKGDTEAKIINVRNISSSNWFISQYELDSITLQCNDVKNYLVTENDILIARSGIPGATRLMYEYENNTIYCGFIIRYQVEKLFYKNYLFFCLKDLEASTTSKSSGTIMQNVNQDTLKRMLFIVPDEHIVKNFNNFIAPIFQSINKNIKENQKLSELRDWLLPMLMNGQVKVIESEQPGAGH